MKNCNLCFNLMFEKNLLPVETKQDCGSSIRAVVERYFWFSDKILDSNKSEERWVCKTCWHRLEDFHEFFCNVKSNYKIDDSEVLIEDHCESIDEHETLVETLDEEFRSSVEEFVPLASKDPVQESNLWDNLANKRKYGEFVEILERFKETPKKKSQNETDQPKEIEKYRFLCRICKRVNTGFIGTTGPIRSHLKRVHGMDMQELDAAIMNTGDHESRVYKKRKRSPSDHNSADECVIEALDNDE